MRFATRQAGFPCAAMALLLVAAFAIAAAPTSASEADTPAVAPAAQATNWTPVALLATFALLLVLPFVPGMIEVVHPRDHYPLPVDLAYTKDPRHLGRRLRRILRDGLADHLHEAGMHPVRLSRPDMVRVADGLQLADDEVCEDTVVVRGRFVTGRRATLTSDAYVQGSATLGAGTVVRTLACDGQLDLATGVIVRRWLDCDGDITATEHCDLGGHCAAARVIRLTNGVRFARLSAEMIVTPGGHSRPARELPADLPPLPRPERPAHALDHGIDTLLAWHPGDLTLGREAQHAGDLVVRGTLRLEAGAILRGRVRGYREVTLGEGVVLDGDLFADGDVTLADGVTVTGHVFSQGRVTIGRRVQVGVPGQVRSVIGNQGVQLGPAVVVHGYVQTEGEGVVACHEPS